MKQIYNPISPLTEFIPDGEPHVFGGRLYLFGSHDKQAGETYCMLPYVAWSAPVEDLADWHCSGTIYSPEQDSKYDAEVLPYAFASDVVRGNDGRFYLYYCMAGECGRSGYAQPISVAVCDRPNGRYEYLGEVKNPDGSVFLKYANFDPAVINDDGIIRLYSGTWYSLEDRRNFLNSALLNEAEARILGKDKAHIKKLHKSRDSPFGPHHMTLADDMLTITSEPVRILPLKHKGTLFEEHGFFEGSSIRKIGKTYYFVYSSVQNHELCYATSRYPDRDFAYGGTIVSNGDIGYEGRETKDRLNHTGTTHGSIEQVGGQWYIFYHRLTHKTDYSRQACAEKICIKPDGRIDQVEMTSCGLNARPLKAEGIYPAAICCNLTNGRMPHGSNKKIDASIPYVGSDGKDVFVKDVSGGTWIGYKSFSFDGQKNIVLTVRGEANGSIAAFDAMNGSLLGKADIFSEPGWHKVERLSIFGLSGAVRLIFWNLSLCNQAVLTRGCRANH